MLKKYKTVIPDLEYYQKIFSCGYACPVSTQAGNYVQAIARGEDEKAYEIARRPNPFIHVCGRVCAHPCETACRRGCIDEPISIRALKRFAAEKHHISNEPNLTGKSKNTNGKKVAVIGAGPAGLSAAHDLAILGYLVTVFEKSNSSGGMLYRGLPKYRLPREVIEKEIEEIVKLGIEMKFNTEIGKDVSLSGLKKDGFEAIFIAVGATSGRGLNIEGSDFDGVLNGIDFLLNVNLGYKVDLGKKVVIVGGGNVAIDVARSALRETGDVGHLSHAELKNHISSMQSEIRRLEQPNRRKSTRMEGLTVALDVARSVTRMEEDVEIKMICMESKEEMPAHHTEVDEAVAEGVTLLPSKGPRRIHGKNGKVTGIETIDVASIFDDKGRFNPVYVEGTNNIIEAESVILAIGQTPDLSFISTNDKIEMKKNNTIKVDNQTLATTAEGVFAGGDAAFGARLIIDAVADGQKAALSIHRYLQKEEINIKKNGQMKIISSYSNPGKYDSIPRQNPPVLPIDRRIGLAEVELSYSEESARLEGNRCLRCNINTIFDGSKCILCGGCIDVCPEYCLKLVRVDQMESTDELNGLLEKVYGKNIREMNPEEVSGLGTAIIKYEDRCIRCGLCMERCPVQAITMEEFSLA